MIRSRKQNTNLDCCGTGVYDKIKQECDGIEARDRLSNKQLARCEGTSDIYNTTVKVCCKGNIIDKPKGYSIHEKPTCCGNTVIVDKLTQICSRNHVVPKGHIWCETGM